MAEQRLDEADIGPILQHQRRHRVPKQVAGAGLPEVGCLHVIPYQLRHAVGGKPRPAFSEVKLSLLEDDVVELELKSPTASGQRVVHLHPVQFFRRLAWLIPPPKQNQVRYYGVFAPTHGLRAQVVPKKVELAVVRDDGDEDDEESAGDGGGDRYRVAWAKLLAKVFDVDAERCPTCGGRLRPVGAVTRREEARAALAAGLSVLGARGPPTAA